MSSTVRLDAGSIDTGGNLTAGSMARAIADALDTLVPLGAHEDPRGRRKLALAIARGVIGHLAANAGAIMVTVPDTSGGSTHEQPATQIDKV
jgi:hypothetical protein